jgi:hypothetical protein
MHKKPTARSRIEDLGAELPDQERNVLDWLLDHGQCAAISPLSDADLAAAGAGASGDPSTITVTVSWSR